MRLEFRAARTGDGWEALDAAVARGRARRWFAYVSAIPRPDTVGAWRATMDYDPVPVLERVGCPLLACFGERDPYLPVRESAARLAAAGKRAGNPEVTVKVFPGANHSLIVEGPGGDLRFAAGYFGTVAE